MKQLFLLLFCAFIYAGTSAQTIMGRQLVDQFPISSTGTLTYGLTWLPQSYATTTRSYPLIISLHGSGETGTTVADLAKMYNASPRAIAGRIADGWNATAINPLTGVEDSFIVVSPQAPSWSYSYTELKFILPSILSKYRIDASRIYLTGLSAGGGGTFSTLGSMDVDFIKKFAAMATASSAGTNASNGLTAVQVEAGIRFGSTQNVHVWTVAGEQDYLLNVDVKYHDSTNISAPNPANKLTVLQGVGHSTWGRTYDPNFRPVNNYYGKTGSCQNGCNNGGIPVAPNANGSAVRGSGITQDSLNLYEWFLLYQRSTNTVPVTMPTANAGADQVIALPASSATLNGSGNPGSGNSISSFLWSKISGPAQFAIVTPNAAQTTVNNLLQGVYNFELVVTNSVGVTAKDTVTLTIGQQQNVCVGKSYMPSPGGDRGYYNSVNLQPGDTLFIDASKSWSYVYLQDRHGTPTCPIYVMNKGGQAKLTGNQLKLFDCSYIKVLGTGSSNTQYGFLIQPYPDGTLRNGMFALVVAGRSKNIEVSNVSIRNCGIGIEVKQDGSCDPNYNYPNWVIDSISIHDNHIVNTWNQGMYLGNTSPDNSATSYSPRPVVCNGVTTYPMPFRLGNLKVYNNYVDSTGRGGIQLSSASTGISEIYNNTVKHNGMNGDDAQGSAIVVGAYTRAYIHHNNISNTLTWGISSMGASGINIPLRIEENIIDSSGYLRHYNLATNTSGIINILTEPIYNNTLTWPYSIFVATKPTLSKDSTMFWVKNNTLGRRKNIHGIGLADYQNTMHKSGNFICNNVNATGGVATINIEEVIPIFYSGNCTSPQNISPVVNAGTDKTITLPINTTTLSGSASDADGFIAFYQWTKVAGPTQFTFAAPTAAQTAVSNLAQGIYKFELRVTDNLGALGKDTVTVTVNAAPPANQAPTANAGTNQTITLPVNTVTFSGSGTDTDGTIAAYQWTKISGPTQFAIAAPTSAQTAVSNLAQGVYSFELRVTDNLGAIGRDTINVTVNAAPPANQAPTANAGTNQTITLPVNAVTFPGSGTDADGTIAAYQWIKISGPTQFVIAAPTSAQTGVSNLAQGVYSFELRVTDNLGAIGRDTVNVTVNAAPPANQTPTANAGTNQTITLPVNTVTFSGSGTDADGTIASYQWIKISGPTQFVIAAPTSAQTAVSNLAQGVYSFELRVTDNLGAIGRDTINVTVNAAPPANQTPTANAGTSQTITLPTNTVTISGSGTDADGSIASYQWTKISGPAQFNIVSPTTVQTVVNNLLQGAYSFELRVMDNLGAIGRDTVNVTVNAAAPPNASPTANAGLDKTILLPVNTVTFTGSGTDADGTIAAYQWTKISGPAQFIIASPTSAQTAVNNLVQGVYSFELRVTDNFGAIGRDTVNVTVNIPPPPPPPLVNLVPVANAGMDQTITLPVSTVSLAGTGTDGDGSIASYQWTKISGPAQFSIVTPASAQTTVNNLKEGEYSFELKVTDNLGAVGRDTILVTVKPLDSKKSGLAKIYPNPAVSIINIEINNLSPAGKTTLRIINANGKLIYQKEIVLNQPSLIQQVDVSSFNAGLYYVYISNTVNKSPSLSFIKL